MSKLNKEREAFKAALQKNASIAASLPLANSTSRNVLQQPQVIIEESSTILQRPIASYIFTILSFLKERQNTFLTFEEINQQIRKEMFSGSNHFNSIVDYPEIMKRIKGNSQFQVNSQEGIRFIPLLRITNRMEFLSILSQTPNGLSINELREGTPSSLIDSIINSLLSEGLILMMPIGNSTNSDTIIFEQLSSDTSIIDAGFRRLWRNTTVPLEDSELRGLMVKLKLKIHGPTQEKGAPSEFGGIEGARERMASSRAKRSSKSLSNDNKKKENPYRRIKITNDYLDGIDLNDSPLNGNE